MFGGGFPGMDGMGGMHGRRRKAVDNTGYYKALGVDKDASASQIKKAYRKMAMTVGGEVNVRAAGGLSGRQPPDMRASRAHRGPRQRLTVIPRTLSP
jgi:hypothetical protein